MKTTERLDEIAGRICKSLIPVRKEYHLGGGGSVAICTLSSLDLLERIFQTPALMDKIAIVGRLLSENKGIDAIIRFCAEHPDLERIVLCGREVHGHRAGQALLSLARNGIYADGRIVGALGPYPLLHSEPDAVSAFRNRVQIIDLVGVTRLETIAKLVT